MKPPEGSAWHCRFFFWLSTLIEASGAGKSTACWCSQNQAPGKKVHSRKHQRCLSVAAHADSYISDSSDLSCLPLEFRHSARQGVRPGCLRTFLCWPMKLHRSYCNWALLLIVAVPPVCTCYLLSHFCAAAEIHSSLCDIYVHMPLLSVNILWLIHVDITFYIVSLVQVSRITRHQPALCQQILALVLCTLSSVHRERVAFH